MTQEQFEALGIEKSLAKKAADDPRKNWKDMLPKKPMTQPNSSESSWKQQ